MCEVDIDPDSFEAILVWPDLKKVVTERVNDLFKKEIDTIKEDYPLFAIFTT
jgi:hypothetical protein